MNLKERDRITGKWKKNWKLLVSGLAFFCLNVQPGVGFYLAVGIAFAVSLFLFSWADSIPLSLRKVSFPIRMWAMLSAAGVCWAEQTAFYLTWNPVVDIGKCMPGDGKLVLAAGVLIAVFSVYFVYCGIGLFLNRLVDLLREILQRLKITQTERIVYSLIFLCAAAVVCSVFSQTDAFYGAMINGETAYDIVYTSDSSYLVRGNAYLVLSHGENDLRQPLFAVFSAPFLGAPYLLGRLLGGKLFVMAFLQNCVQIAILLTANLVLADILRLSPVRRICFMLLLSATYMFFLFSLMMEQYIVAYFWLILCLWCINERKQDFFVMCGAGGSLLTSMILLPAMYGPQPGKEGLRKWIRDVSRKGAAFVLTMLALCRFDVFFGITSKMVQLNRYIGTNVAAMDKLFQYTAFVRDCFIAPAARRDVSIQDYAAWQLIVPEGLCIAGIALLVAAIVSAVLNRKKRSSVISAGWVVFSFVILFLMGWGTQENGLILYALYFGWAFFVLLFQLVEKIEDHMKICYLIPAVTVVAGGYLLYWNLTEIGKLIRFATDFYPL